MPRPWPRPRPGWTGLRLKMRGWGLAKVTSDGPFQPRPGCDSVLRQPAHPAGTRTAPGLRRRPEGRAGAATGGTARSPHPIPSPPPALPPALQQLQGLRQVQSQLPGAEREGVQPGGEGERPDPLPRPAPPGPPSRRAQPSPEPAPQTPGPRGAAWGVPAAAGLGVSLPEGSCRPVGPS